MSDSEPDVATPEPAQAGLLPNIAVALSMTAVFVAFLGVLLTAATTIGLTGGETTAWIMAAYGIPGLIGLVLSWRYRQPLLMTGNAFILIFIAGLGTEFSWPELVGGSMLAGLAVLVMVPLGLTDRLARLLPAPIVFGLLAGAVLPFITDMFFELGEEPLLVGTILVSYLLAKAFLEPRVPAILPALFVGLIVAGLIGLLGSDSASTVTLLPVITTPDFSLSSILTVAPVMVVLITVQANIPSVIVLRGHGYDPPERGITLLSGVGTTATSLLGAVGLSLSLPATAYTAGPDSGPIGTRYRSVVIAAGALTLIGILGGFAAQISDVVPPSFLIAIAGLALIGVFADAIGNVTKGPLLWGPIFAFAIALSGMSLFGLGAFFWAIVGGLAVSLLLERPAWRSLQDQESSQNS